MKYLVVKVKGKDLFFNADEAEGEFLCDTPIFLDRSQCDSIIDYCEDLVDISNGDIYTTDDLEIAEVTLVFSNIV